VFVLKKDSTIEELCRGEWRILLESSVTKGGFLVNFYLF